VTHFGETDWPQVRRLALELAQRQPWWDPELAAWRQRIRDLHAAAERLGPEDPATWECLAHAAALAHELRLLGEVFA